MATQTLFDDPRFKDETESMYTVSVTLIDPDEATIKDTWHNETLQVFLQQFGEGKCGYLSIPANPQDGAVITAIPYHSILKFEYWPKRPRKPLPEGQLS